MRRKIVFVFFFQLLFVQGQQLEDAIYKATDDYLLDKSSVALEKLNQQEQQFEKQVKTKSEFLALVILQCNKAFSLKENNQYQKAIVTYEKAWRNYKNNQLSGYDIVEYCLKPLGNLYTKTKDYANAENIIKYYISKAEKENNTNQKIAGIINLSIVYQSVNQHSIVMEITSKSLQTENIPEAQKSKLERIYFNSSLLSGQEIKPESIQEFSHLEYQEKLKEKKYKEAFEIFNKLKTDKLEEGINPRESAKLFLEEAQLLLLLEEDQKANQSINEALVNLIPNYKASDSLSTEELYPESLLIDVFDMKAVLEDVLENKLRNYDKSFYVSDLLERNITTQQTKIILQSEKRKRSEACISLLVEAYNSTKKPELLERAFLYADKGKSEVLNSQIGKRNLWRKYPEDSLLITEKQLLKKQETIINALIKAQISNADNDKISELNSMLQEVSVAIKNLQSKINVKYPDANVNKFNLSELQDKLTKEKTTLVNYFYGSKNIFQFILHEDEIKIQTIKNTSNNQQLIIDYIKLFDDATTINNDVESYSKKAFELYKLLRFDKLKDESKINIIADGLLNFIPFETLLTEATEEDFYSQMPFLVKKHNITYSFNVNSFLRRREIEQKEKVVGFFPVFLNTEKELKYSLQEASVIGSNFPSKIFKTEEATKDNFIQNINNASVIHLSTHAKSDVIPTNSYVDFYDEKLYVNELYSLECDADLVVLSACETGVGVLMKGEGVMSISRAFSYIGVSNLLFSLWEINDKSTAKLMENFYKTYKKTKSFSLANQNSKIDYLNNESIENSKKSPYYWGAFVYYGSHTVSYTHLTLPTTSRV